MSSVPVQSVLIAALGGEGGGVLAEWLVACAREAGLAVQATSVPGVAQRTGATSYYIEWSQQPVPHGQAVPVFSLSPVPARVDAVVASEWLEAARMMERGFVTPERTCLIASTSRVYTTIEKMHMDDGRFDAARIHALAQSLARKSVLMDMEALTQQHQTVVSAVMFGALFGAGILPWSVAVCEAAIQASGKGVQASLAGFHAARAQAEAGQGIVATQTLSASAKADGWPAELAQMVRLGEERCLDYQDQAYADTYREMVRDAIGPAPLTEAQAQVWIEAVRHLALWMCYEDVIRVADLKTRPQRFARVREEARAGEGDLVYVTEHFKPGVDEVASVMPRWLGLRLLKWAAGSGKSSLHWGLHIRSTSLWGYLMLRFLARLRPWRRGSLRFSQEHAAMTTWWATMRQLVPVSAEMSLALAGLPQVLKGYGDTQLRGRQNYERLWRECVTPALQGQQDLHSAADRLHNALKATLADPEGHLNTAAKEQAIQWFQKIPA